MDAATTILFQIFFIFLLAKLVGEVFERLKQPPVIGELLVGVLLGTGMLYTNLTWGGARQEWLNLDTSQPSLALLAELGAIFLLFSVGLETKLSDLKKVGVAATLVALLGVVFPFGLGYIALIAWGKASTVAMFVAAAMVATSVGITARVLYDLRAMDTVEAKIILGAAVIDDVLGMIVLSIVSGSARGGTVSWLDIIFVAAMAVVFVVAVVVLGERLVRRMSGRRAILGPDKKPITELAAGRSDRLGRMKMREGPFIVALILCFAISAIASEFGLTAIIGAFLAGMIFAEVKERYNLEEKFTSINEFLVPFFFVHIGMMVRLERFNEVWLLATVITVLAVLGKVVGCGLAVSGRGRRSASIIGVGMIPRGEVGFVIAGAGMAMGILTADLYLVVIVMAIATTLVAPPILAYLLKQPPDGATEFGRDREWKGEAPKKRRRKRH